MISDVLDSLLLNEKEMINISNKAKKDVLDLCGKYPIYESEY